MTAEPGRISLLISDVDGTLVTKDKQLTEAAAEAIRSLDRAGIGFTIVSSRPPRGLAKLFQTVQPLLPFGGFNGGSVVDPADGTVLEQVSLPPAAARKAIDYLAGQGIAAWVFDDGEWLITDPAGPHVDHERFTVGFEARVVERFEDSMLQRVGKIVGASNDHAHLARCEAGLQAVLGGSATAIRSQAYYLDVTNTQATKGHFVRALARRLSIPLAEIAVIGDADNDVSMFKAAGFAIAMGNATDAVKAEADATTAGNNEEGFAQAVERLVIPRAGAGPASARPKSGRQEVA